MRRPYRRSFYQTSHRRRASRHDLDRSAQQPITSSVPEALLERLRSGFTPAELHIILECQASLDRRRLENGR